MRTDFSPGQITQLLNRWRGGEEAALDDLLPLIYSELRILARSRLAPERRLSMTPTELVHEAFLRLVHGGQPEWANRAHFYYIAARVMRQVLVDFAREHGAQKRGGGIEPVPLAIAENNAGKRDPSVTEIHEALSELGRVDGRKARVLEMRYFAGMTAEEIAAVEGIAPVTVTRDMRAATAWVRAYLSPGTV